MRYLELDSTPRMSKIGLGTWQFGSREWGYGADYADREAQLIVRRALELGINLVDTAEVYGSGRSERIVGRALADRREHVLIATKLFPVAPLEAVVLARARASARRLDVECLDLYQVHWPNPLFGVATTMRGMRRAQQARLVGEVGVSNFSLQRWQEAEEALGHRVLSNQVAYSLARRDPERELLAYAQRCDRVIIAYSPLAQGLLSARYDASNTPGGVRAANPLFLSENLRRAGPLLNALREVAAAHDVTPAQIALAWVIRRPNVVAIPGASSVAQLEANAAAADLDLTEAEDTALTHAADAFRPVTGAAAAPRVARRLLGRA